MQTHCNSDQFEFEGFDRRKIVAAFDGGAITSDARRAPTFLTS